MKIWVVKEEWDYLGCPDDYMDCHAECVEKVFDSEEKAFKYIQDKIRLKIELTDERNMYTDLDETPSIEFIKNNYKDGISYLEDYEERSYYRCYEYDVE